MPCKSFNPIFLNVINIFYHYLYFILSESAILGFDFFRLVHMWLGFCLYLFPPNKFLLNFQFLWKCENPMKKISFNHWNMGTKRWNCLWLTLLFVTNFILRLLTINFIFLFLQNLFSYFPTKFKLYWFSHELLGKRKWKA